MDKHEYEWLGSVRFEAPVIYADYMARWRQPTIRQCMKNAFQLGVKKFFHFLLVIRGKM